MVNFWAVYFVNSQSFLNVFFTSWLSAYSECRLVFVFVLNHLNILHYLRNET